MYTLEQVSFTQHLHLSLLRVDSIMVDSEMAVTGWEPGCSRRVGLLV